MPKKCDHTSVGMFVWRDDKLLLIERMKFPPGFAVPAGHVDEDVSYEDSAKRELKEEVGLEVVDLKLILDERKENKCRREDGSWHHWKIYEAKVTGDIKRSESETKRVGWYSKEQIKALATRTEEYYAKKISDEEWTKSPGIEPVMYEFMKEMNII